MTNAGHDLEGVSLQPLAAAAPVPVAPARELVRECLG